MRETGRMREILLICQLTISNIKKIQRKTQKTIGHVHDKLSLLVNTNLI